MFFSQPRVLALMVSLSAGGCASSQLEPTTVSSAHGSGYALGYVDQLKRARDTFERDDVRARELGSSLRAHAAALKLDTDRAIALRIVEQSDESGRGQNFSRSRSDERALRSIWEDERGALGARVGGAAQKEVLDAGCNQVDVVPAVQRALRDGFDRQLERRMRASNEGQRTLEQNKARLSPAGYTTLAKLSDEVALTSQLVHVALVEDVRELDRLIAERNEIDSTLARTLDDERAIQSDPKRPSEQKASQDRVIQVEKQRALIGPEVQKLEAERHQLDERQRLAASEYENTLRAVKDSLQQPALQAPSDNK
ncbi:MAG: hypothetical protein RLZZ450_4054 [Pseudomonadota bacterium]|jgi:hypothetical protein